MENSNMPQYAQVFGGVLKARRLSLGVSQEELAFRAGVDRTFVSRIERGVRQPTVTTIFLLAQALEVSGSDLLREVESLM